MTTLAELERRVKAIEKHLSLTAVTTPSHHMYVGVNADALTTPIEAIIESGASFCRFPVWADAFPDRQESYRAYHKFASALITNHIEPLIVCDNRSWADNNYPLWAALPVHYIQMGNEWDIVSDSSFTQTVKDFSADLRWARTWFDTFRPDGTPPRYIIAGGAASGHEWLLQDADLTVVDAIAVHPYGQRADNYPTATYGHGNLRDLIRRYKTFHKPVWITENGWKDSETSQKVQAELLRRTIEIAEEEGVVGYLVYTLREESSEEFDLDPGVVLEAFKEEAIKRHS